MNPKSVFLCELKECSKNKTTWSISDFTVIQVLSLFIAQPAIADENKYIPLPISTTIGKDTVYRRLTEFGPPMWQAEADTELTPSALPATAVGQILLTMAKFC